MPDIKQVIVIRKDLKMRRGKEIAQGAHASMAWLSRRMQFTEPHPWENFGTGYASLSGAEMDWLRGSFTKVTLQVQTEQELYDLQRAAHKAGLEAHLITDAGLTEFDGEPTVTALGIGPDYAELIDPVTGDLKLY